MSFDYDIFIPSETVQHSIQYFSLLVHKIDENKQVWLKSCTVLEMLKISQSKFIQNVPTLLQPIVEKMVEFTSHLASVPSSLKWSSY